MFEMFDQSHSQKLASQASKEQSPIIYVFSADAGQILPAQL